jgi:hypothetical protein
MHEKRGETSEPDPVLAGNAQLTRHRRSRLAASLHHANRFALEFRAKPLTLFHRTPPCEDCPRF